MRRSIALILATLLALSALVAPAAADEHPPGSPFDHPHTHALLVGADVTWVAEPEPGQPPYIINDYRRCVDLAGGKALRTNVHHEKIHVGRAGQALAGAGHLVIPIGILGYTGGCAQLDTAYGK
jgi:hypothetical protein